MSAALQTETAGDDPAAGGYDPEIEARARKLGWKDRGEFRNGEPADWVDPAAYIDRNEGQVPLLKKNLDRLLRDNGRYEKQIADMRGMLDTLSEGTRKAEERAYRRAKAELEAERKKAIQSGDTEAFDRADKEMRELEAEAPKGAPKVPAAAAAPTLDPVVKAWVDENSWFTSNTNMAQAADAIHRAIVAEKPGLSLADSLAETKNRIMIAFPDKFENQRRRSPALVSGSSEGAPSPRSTGRGFADMPRESQEQFGRYSKMLAGKGKPLTKDEWAANFWEQYKDVP